MNPESYVKNIWENWNLGINYDFLILISTNHYVVDLRYFKLLFLFYKISLSLKSLHNQVGNICRVCWVCDKDSIPLTWLYHLLNFVRWNISFISIWQIELSKLKFAPARCFHKFYKLMKIWHFLKCGLLSVNEIDNALKGEGWGKEKSAKLLHKINNEKADKREKT